MSLVRAADPDALDAAARRLDAVALGLDGCATATTAAQRSLTLGWWGPGLLTWAQAGDAARAAARVGGLRLGITGLAVRQYAADVRALQARLRQLDDAEREVHRQHGEAVRARAALPPGSPPGPDPAVALAEGLRELARARSAVDDAAAAAGRVLAQALHDAADDLAGRYAGLTPLAAALRGAKDGVTLWSGYSRPKNVPASIERARHLLAYGKSLQHGTTESADALRQLERALAGLDDASGPEGVAAWRRYALATQAERTRYLRTAAFGEPVQPVGRLARLAPARTVLGKVALPLAMVGDVYVLTNPNPDHGTTHQVLDGASAAVNLGASGLAVAAAVGLVTLGPVTAAVVGGALVVTAAYSAGSYLYDHRHDIAKVVVGLGEVEVQVATAVAHSAAASASAAVHGVEHLGQAAVGAAHEVGSAVGHLVPHIPVPGPPPVLHALKGLLG